MKKQLKFCKHIFILLFFLSCSENAPARTIIEPLPPVQAYTCEIESTKNCIIEENEGVCQRGVQFCTYGWDEDVHITEWSDCIQELQVSDDICDGLDNDCDGDIDDVKPIECEPEGAFVGVYNREDPDSSCYMGLSYCHDGTWSDCHECDIEGRTAENPNCWVGPQNETCDSVDNNCNGIIDDIDEFDLGECGYYDEETGEYFGECINTGYEYCIYGDIICLDFISPENEVCDGRDNNCDGETDENLFRPCETECDVGLEECLSGFWINCNANACECEPYSTRRCPREPCGWGQEECLPDGSGWDGDCIGNDIREEICNNHDDNCSCDWEQYEIDPASVGFCYEELDEDESTETGLLEDSCYEGPIDTLDVGECHNGWKFCLFGVWSVCMDQQLPIEEYCDGLDNDCDGFSDDEEETNSATDLVVLIDMSGSMLGDRVAIAEAFEAFSDSLADNLHCAIITFGGEYPAGGLGIMRYNLGPIDGCITELWNITTEGGGSIEPSYDVIYDVIHPDNVYSLSWRADEDDFATPVIIIFSDEYPQSNVDRRASTLEPFLLNCQVPGCKNPPNIYWTEGDPFEIFFIVEGAKWENLVFADGERLFHIWEARRDGINIVIEEIFERVCIYHDEE